MTKQQNVQKQMKNCNKVKNKTLVPKIMKDICVKKAYDATIA